MLIVATVVLLANSPPLRPFAGGRPTASDQQPPLLQSADKDDADITILFIGNSHVEGGDPVPRLVECFKNDASGETIFTHIRAIGNAHMEDHLQSQQTLVAIDDGGWDYVVLQGQNYSASGRYDYPTDACIELGRRIVATGAKVLLFPEWRQVGNDDEAVRVQKIHEGIAPQIPARIVSVGLAWDLALARRPELRLHSPDGNHSSSTGGYLTGLVLYACITGRDPRGLPSPPILQLSDETTDLLQTVAWEIAGKSHTAGRAN